ncbi:DUF1674 domain-containing protein [Roseinatronobacter bogoriensis]|uniref:DUF1674 domain-containing protein n=1 Tax=Roseinatronobacter bogoriensis subsp. barguzinensis TaxID=441209 RepID=A0A2K8K6M7_9RHOB|nr:MULTISPECIES: DUF1674 domain-containing protein [Rhodobaca]ATX65104.1 DUF1674 domain-containing protein [Rhodobaca barguzinensis]MBB4209590.1 hypothetical protein [Rhodobaca bogoriensis DSM 18756]TDW35419.1 hypothetical protein LY39_03138 [Rhodobaca barguzinensis]TDY66629.1 hypothetical protein EV660_11078 [Rhodobaca bogoriensis DSM 18756]
MTDDTATPDDRPSPSEAERRATLPPAARRALEEADARRDAQQSEQRPTELGGRKGPEPVRYGDWEKKGIAIDF